MATPYTPLPISFTDAREKREIFERALVEFMDDTMRNRVTWMIWRFADALVQEHGMGADRAVSYATEIIGQCVWKKVTAGR